LAEQFTIETIRDRLCVEIQTMLSLKPNSITLDTAMDPLGIDSMKLVSLIILIEKKFGVDLVRTGLKSGDLKTVRSLAAAIDAGQKV
jgi:acyl carrier protein